MQYELKARVWFRESTQEWVLEIEGEIGDAYITNRHTCPADTNPVDVPALSHLYPEN